MAFPRITQVEFLGDDRSEDVVDPRTAAAEDIRIMLEAAGVES